MYIKLIFDYDVCVIYVPDGYIDNKSTLQSDFYKWISCRSECANNRNGLIFDSDCFLKFVNSEILVNSNEKAYYVNSIQKNVKKSLVLKF